MQHGEAFRERDGCCATRSASWRDDDWRSYHCRAYVIEVESRQRDAVGAAILIRLRKLPAVWLAMVVAIGSLALWYAERSGSLPISTRNPQIESPQDDGPRPNPTPDWPTLRGPQYDGHSIETGIVESWPEAGPPVLWTRPLGQGYSAFVASGDRVYTQYQSLAGQYVVCLDAESGETLWEYRYDWPYEAAGVYPGPRATPTLAGGDIYFAGPSGLVGCLSDSGRLRWSMNVVKELGGRGAGFGYACSPIVEQGRVLLPVGGPGAAMVALDAVTGKTVWQSGDDAASYAPALPISVNGQRQVIGYLENSLVAFDFETGKVLWRLDLSQGYDEHSAWPIYLEPDLWISGPFRSGSQLLKLSGGDEANQLSVWRSKLLSNDVCSSVAANGFLFGFDLRDVQAKTHRPSRGVFRCLEFATGIERWSTDATGHSTVLVADGKLILFNDKGEVILARASADRYEELARTAVFSGEISWTPPALHRGRLYLRTHTRAACLFLGDPERLQDTVDTPTLTVADIPKGADWHWESILGVEPEYAFDVPSLSWLRNWFAAGMAIFAVSAIVALLTALVLRLTQGKVARSSLLFGAFLLTGFLLGAIATTPLSLWKGEFVFTWPVSLYIAFYATVQQARLRRGEIRSGTTPWKERVAAILFVAVCGGYYLLCRRLSLVFEWVYLCGFIAALPVLVIERLMVGRAWWEWIVRPVTFSLGFTAYYWGSFFLLFWKYRVPFHE